MANKLIGQRDNPNRKEFLNNLREGKIALIDINLSVMVEKARFCKIMPEMRWHVAELDMYLTQMSLGFRKSFDRHLKQKINKLYATHSENCLTIMIHNYLRVKIFGSIGLLTKWFDDLSKAKYDTHSQNEYICLFGQEESFQASFEAIGIDSLYQLFWILASMQSSAFIALVVELWSMLKT